MNWWLPWFVVATTLSASSGRAAAKQPNVLLICVDDLKPALGCYGDAAAKTPHVDRLAARGVRFSRAYCNQAVCSPSRNALLVGLRPQSSEETAHRRHMRARQPADEFGPHDRSASR